MTVQYVIDVMSLVEEATRARGVPEGLFWDWLGNSKFVEDEGDLTPERAEQISRQLGALLDEWRRSHDPNSGA